MTSKSTGRLRLGMKADRWQGLRDALKRQSPTKADLWNYISCNIIALAIIVSALIIRFGA